MKLSPLLHETKANFHAKLALILRLIIPLQQKHRKLWILFAGFRHKKRSNGLLTILFHDFRL